MSAASGPNAPAACLAIDRLLSTLTVDRQIDWQRGAAVTYRDRGITPDMGAIETQ